MIWLAITCLGLALLSTLIAWRFHVALGILESLAPADDDGSSDDGAPLDALDVVIPARNEEHDIGDALRSVLAQDGVDLRVIVVDDHSTDRTGEIIDEIAAADERVVVVRDPPLEPGWFGKTNAMRAGLERARDGLVLFTDADVVHRPRCFRTALSLVRKERLDFLGLFPLIHCVSVIENAIVPAYVAGMLKLMSHRLNDPSSPDALAAGAFMLTRRSVLEECQALESVRQSMLDDVDLARRVKRSGYRTRFLLALDLLEVRLFKGNRDAFWGMTKNVLADLDRRFWLGVPMILVSLGVLCTPVAATVAGVALGDGLVAAAGAGAYVSQYLGLLPAQRMFAVDRLKLAAFPLGALAVTACIARALYFRLVRGGVRWRGRTIDDSPTELG